MLAILASGIALWVVYGFLKGDMVIIIANAVSLALLFNLLFFKVRENASAREHKPA
jgi:MtN3 and saliva related transmembrane protein